MPVLPGQTTTTIDVSGDVAAKNYLIVGSDSRACIDPGSPYAGAFLTEGNDIGDRSDTIMVLRVDPDESQAAILSFPRDLWVRIGSSNRKARINSAFDKEDPSRLVETIEQNFEIPVDHYIEVDFCAFKYLVDAVGGVKIPFEFRRIQAANLVGWNANLSHQSFQGLVDSVTSLVAPAH